jgi:hypothetical protein
MIDDDEGTSEGAQAVADQQWQRVRALAQVADRLARQEAESGLDDDGEMRLARARLRAARAADRALLADQIADRIAELRPDAPGVSAKR